jgi:hypothetical protein
MVVASSAVKSMSIPLMVASGSQKGFVVVNTGAVAGADIG